MMIFIMGGVGYIGSYCCVVFLEVGYDVVVVDNLFNVNLESFWCVLEIIGRLVVFEQVDICD